MILRFYIFACVVGCILSGTRIAEATALRGDSLNCLDCHTCAKPTAQDMCLKPCPTLSSFHKTEQHKVTEAPDVIVLKTIASQYGPVHFNHRLHASMSTMGRNCVTCHHYSPAGEIPPCRECHPSEGADINLRQPGLKGAYHRQCLSCHREWSHDTKCEVCHLPVGSARTIAPQSDPTDIMGRPHPVLLKPTTKLYSTPYSDGPLVTFHHEEHVDRFGLACVDCHEKESCGNCHDIQPKKKPVRTMAETHAICNDCHKSDPCGKCHGLSEKAQFSHAVTGWPLSRYHEGLSCRSCHPTGKEIVRLDKSCVGCHKGWSQSTFRHAVTGIRLDDNHRELECVDCHIENRYDQPPSCADCHDETYTPATKTPGTKVN